MLPEIQTLKDLRLEKCWSYQQLADDMGMPYRTVMQWIREEAQPRETMLHQVRKYLAQPRVRKMVAQI